MTKRGTRILVLDDEISIRRFLRISLESHDYQVLEAKTGAEGVEMAAMQRPELIVLDLGLPDMGGIDVLKKIREWSAVPVIVLTVRDAESDKVSALDAGADDYLTKPFSVPELLARIRVALRHAHPEEETPIFRSGPLEIDRSARIVRVDGEEIRLTATEYEILRLLVKYAGKVVTHSQILKEVWGPESLEHTHYLRVYVGQLRKKLRPTPNSTELIMTEPSVGYRLVMSE